MDAIDAKIEQISKDWPKAEKWLFAVWGPCACAVVGAKLFGSESFINSFWQLLFGVAVVYALCVLLLPVFFEVSLRESAQKALWPAIITLLLHWVLWGLAIVALILLIFLAATGVRLVIVLVLKAMGKGNDISWGWPEPDKYSLAYQLRHGISDEPDDIRSLVSADELSEQLKKSRAKP